MTPHLFLLASLVLTIASQLTMKSRALAHTSVSEAPADYLGYVVAMATDWRVVSAAIATFAASVCWLMAIRRLDLGYALPFMALSFVVVPVAAKFMFAEPLPPAQMFGLALIVAGVAVSALAK